jgi:nitrite reductase/ring-hydroxylating ferredoxin subunit
MQKGLAPFGQVMAENFVPVCAAADIPPGTVKSFEVGDELVALYNIDGAFYATEGSCTHAFGAFHVPSGKAVQAPCFTDLKTYRTQVKDGQVFVDLSSPAPSA